MHEWSCHLEIFSLSQPIENFWQFLLLRTDIFQKAFNGCSWLSSGFKFLAVLEPDCTLRLPLMALEPFRGHFDQAHGWLKLIWIVTFAIQAYFRRICLESLEHNDAYISPLICTNRLIFGKGAFFFVFFLNMTSNPITSQIWIFVTSLFPSLFTNETPSWFAIPLYLLWLPASINKVESS